MPRELLVAHRFMRFRTLMITASFMLFLYPVGIGELSVNYTFLLLPAAWFVLDGRICKPPNPLTFLMGLYTVIFIVASLYQYEFYDEGLRRTVSFVIFMSMFSYTFVNFDEDMIASFKLAIVSLSLLLAVSTIFAFFVSGGASLGFEAKDVVGSQRIGFIYVFALWIVHLHSYRRRLYRVLRYPTIVILLAGLFLTFSRSSLVALMVSALGFGLAGLWRWCRRPSVGKTWKTVLSLFGIVCVIAILDAFVPLVFSFFDTRLFLFLLETDAVSQDLSNPASTGGTRVFLLRGILDFVLRNPLTGSGYLGVWSIFGEQSGSAHSQYADVLFRTGFIGFVAYVCLLWAVGRHLLRRHLDLFWGFVGVLCYGMFHETFKESQGAFILAFLVGMVAHELRQSRSGRASLAARSAAVRYAGAG